MRNKEDPRGHRVGTIDVFVTIVDSNGKKYYGGNQGWFPASWWTNIPGQGCGVIASVNEYLYLTGRTTVTKDKYMYLVKEFVKSFPLSHALMMENPGIAIGVAPWEISMYLKSKLAKDGIKVDANWGGKTYYNRDAEYGKTCEMLENGIPVIWAIHNQENNKVKFYRYDDTKQAYTDDYLILQDGTKTCNKVSSHYVVITGVYENPNDPQHKRMLEISSWGEKYYVDYDEYLSATKDGLINNEFSSIEEVKVVSQ